MIFNNHSNLEGQHAFLGASKYHWINYSEDKVAEAYSKFLATQKGTVLHEFACQCIRLGQKLPKSQKTLNMYVNDAIGFKMIPEQILFYSENCFGTADTIMFRNRFLRIHDLKTGAIPAHMEQLKIYAALFCLDYKMYHFVCLKNPIISVFSCARYGLLSVFSDVKLRFHYCVHGSDNYDSVVHYVLAGSGILVQTQ